MNDEGWLEERLRAETAAVPLPPRARWLRGPVPSTFAAPGLAVGAFVVLIAVALGLGLRSMRDDRLSPATAPVITTTAAPSAEKTPSSADPQRPDPGSRVGLEADTRRLLGDLRFRPLIPDESTIPTTTRAQLRADCGQGGPNCLEIRWDLSDDRPNSVTILQGPAGCCLDTARPNAVRDIGIRPGVLAQFIPVQPEFGGPILWWVDTSSGDPVYLAISSPLGIREELVRIARSMRPLASAGFRDGHCNTGPLTESARNGEYVFQTTGLVDIQNEFVFVAKRGAQPGDRLGANLRRLDADGWIGLPDTAAETAGGQLRFRLWVYKPAGKGCWQIDMIDGSNASYVVEVR